MHHAHRPTGMFQESLVKFCRTKLHPSLTEVLFEEALERAKDLDAYFAKNGVVVGPLHGVPVTLKDQFNVKGFDSTLGYVGRSFSPASDDAAVVKMLKSLGAIVIAKTNLPQSIMVSLS